MMCRNKRSKEQQNPHVTITTNRNTFNFETQYINKSTNQQINQLNNQQSKTRMKIASIIISSMLATTTSAFSISSSSSSSSSSRSSSNNRRLQLTSSTKLQSFYSDSSDYKSSDSDFASEEDSRDEFGVPNGADGSTEEESPSVEETPVPMSKNAGSRFLAFVYDRALTEDDDVDVDVTELHENRISLSEEHVMFCRKANLYNETFNSESMADVLWSNQM